MNLSVILIVFGVVFIAELPDKSLFASLALGQRYRRLYVWCGAAAAFLVHVTIAVTAGRLLTLLPHKTVETIVALLFFGGAMFLFFSKPEEEEGDEEAARAKRMSQSFPKVFIPSFIVVFLGEWGDITQITTANYAARYHNTLSVAVGAIAGLWAVTAFGLIAGAKILDRIPAKTVQRITGTVLLCFAIISAATALR